VGAKVYGRSGSRDEREPSAKNFSNSSGKPILKSLFILRYIDDLDLRQAIEKQLNKIESAHRFARAVSIGNPRDTGR
jgi:TnpA family transposase